MKKILVTGSEGMLGRALMEVLASNDIQLIGVDIRSKENQLDITKPKEVNNLIKNINPDIIIHAAAYTDVDGCENTPEKAYMVNVEGTKNIAQAAKNAGAFLIYLSTDYVFDGKKKTPYTEKDEPCPISVYGKSKLSGEKAIKDMLDNYLIIRTSWLFGKGGKNFVDTIIEKAEKSQALKVVDDQIGCPTYAVDLADAILRLCHSEGALATEESKRVIPATLNIANSGSCSWYEFAKEIIQSKGIKNTELKPASSNEITRPAKRPKMSALDNSEYIKLIGKALPTWQDALKRYLREELN